MALLNEDVLGRIYSMYFGVHVLDQLVAEFPNIWYKPSQRLRDLMSKDTGAFQLGATDLEDYIEDHDMFDYIHIHHEGCLNCQEYCFPCDNCHEYIFGEQVEKRLFKYSAMKV